MVHFLLQAKDLSTMFWVEAIYRANYLPNPFSIRVVNSMTSVKKWCGKNPYVDYLITFGCISWAHISNDCRNKLDANNHACIMRAYSKEYKYY